MKLGNDGFSLVLFGFDSKTFYKMGDNTFSYTHLILMTLIMIFERSYYKND